LLIQVEDLNAFCEKRRESSLSLILEEVLAANEVNKSTAITVIGDEMDTIFGY